MRIRTPEQTSTELQRLVGRYAGGRPEGTVQRALASRTKHCARLRDELEVAVMCRENVTASRLARMLVACASNEVTNGDDDGE